MIPCYDIQTSRMLQLSESFDTVARECLRAREDVRMACFRSYGRDVVGHTLRDPAAVATLCAKVSRDGDYYAWCVRGAVDATVNFWGERLGDQASQVCRHVEAATKRLCYEDIAGWLDWIFVDTARRRQVCETFEAPYRDACKGV